MIQAIKMAWKSISSNKMRSFLTMLGVIIGVMSLVVLVSLVDGTTTSVTDQISNMGSNLLTVTVNDDKGNPLKYADVVALEEEEEIEAAAPVTMSSGTAASSYSEEEAKIYGTSGAYYEIQKLELASGRFLKNVDVTNHNYVAVINAGLAIDVMGRTDVVGETIQLEGVEFLIVGVLAADENDSSTTETYEAYIPFTTLVRLSQEVSTNVTTFCASASSEETMELAEAKLQEKMLERFAGDEDAFTVINQSSVMEAMENVTNTLALLLGGIATIALLVGGIGIMNIMLVSVTERTREIGIRKAIGAGRGTIMLQFLIEALMLSLMGCVIGIIMSVLVLAVIGAVSAGEMTCHLSVKVVWIATLFSTLIGVGFGIYPANKAAKKKPIEALRYTG